MYASMKKMIADKVAAYINNLDLYKKRIGTVKPLHGADCAGISQNKKIMMENIKNIQNI
jgi:hypothetical protein